MTFQARKLSSVNFVGFVTNMAYKNFRVVLLTIILLLTAAAGLKAQNEQPFTLTADDLQNDKQIALDKLQWKYHAGDDLEWANPQLDDSNWENLNGSILTLDNLPKSCWNGIGWFRLRLKVDESLTNQQLALIMDHWGASEVYVDSVLVNRFGKVGATAETEEAYRPNNLPFFFELQGKRAEHLIAVRHSLTTLRDPSSLWSRFLFSAGAANFFTKNLAGMKISVGRSPNAVQDYEYAQRADTGNRFWRAGMFLMIGVVFLLLYLFYPSRRANLYFSLAAIINSINLPIYYLVESSHYNLPIVAVSVIFDWLTFASVLIFMLVFLYTEFAGERIPKRFWIFVAGCAVIIINLAFFSDSSFSILLRIAIYLFFIAESIRLMLGAIAERQNGAWIVGIGIVLFDVVLLQRVMFFSYQFFDGSAPFPGWLIFISRQIYLGLVISIAIYLARQFAQTNKTLEAQLVKEVEHERAANQLALEREQEKARFALVEAENESSAKELEEARQLQLSMLPKKLPVIPNLEIAAYMKPATEVGGDYYDFHVGEDGTLTVAVGDATGHGLKAGTVVTATKVYSTISPTLPTFRDTCGKSRVP